MSLCPALFGRALGFVGPGDHQDGGKFQCDISPKHCKQPALQHELPTPDPLPLQSNSSGGLVFRPFFRPSSAAAAAGVNGIQGRGFNAPSKLLCATLNVTSSIVAFGFHVTFE